MGRQTLFQKIKSFNVLFGVVEEHKPFDINIIKNDPILIEKCMKLIREETEEIEQAIKQNDTIEVVDGIADAIYVLCGMAARMGVNLDKILNEVHSNNMTKLCKTEDEAKLTVSWYIEFYKHKQEYDSPEYRLAPDKKHYIVYNKSTGKILKSVNWKPVNLKPLLCL